MRGEKRWSIKNTEDSFEMKGMCGMKPRGWIHQPSEHCSSFPRLSTHRVCACESPQGLWKLSVFKLRPGLASGFAECPAFTALCPVCLILCSHGDKTFLWLNLTKLVLSCSGRNMSSENPAVETKPE